MEPNCCCVNDNVCMDMQTSSTVLDWDIMSDETDLFPDLLPDLFPDELNLMDCKSLQPCANTTISPTLSVMLIPVTPPTKTLLVKHIFSILESIQSVMGRNHIPALQLVCRYKSTTFDSFTGKNSVDSANPKYKLIKRIGRSISTFDAIVSILKCIHSLLFTQSRCTKRDIYYRNIHQFRTQKQVDEIVEDLACSFGISRDQLMIVAASKGVVYGRLWIHTSKGDILDCCSNTTSGTLIPNADTIIGFTVGDGVTTVLVVEKDAVFFSMLQYGFWHTHPHIILITGRGFPDMATRRLVCMLSQSRMYRINPRTMSDFEVEFGRSTEIELGQVLTTTESDLMVLVLVDGDPSGFEIYCTYKFGSKSMAYNTLLACPSSIWVGIHPTSWMLTIDADSLIPLTPHDRCKVYRLLDRNHIRSCKEYQRQLSRMVFMNCKCEIQEFSGVWVCEGLE
ncbi:hypothetical protein BDV3_006656 [Batrachochytrium dendrobatidis]|nr:endodeoxyribonuclease [Batrachochytrium dendrobatidis]